MGKRKHSGKPSKAKRRSESMKKWIAASEREKDLWWKPHMGKKCDNAFSDNEGGGKRLQVRCSSCRKTTTRSKFAMHRNTKPRCSACGGPLNLLSEA